MHYSTMLLFLAGTATALVAADPPNPICGTERTSACWLELSNHPDCYVWAGEHVTGTSGMEAR